MGNFELKLDVFYRYLKLRFLIISIFIIIALILLPIWVPYMPDFNPVYSINSDHKLGHSQLRSELGNYTISQEYLADKDTYMDADLLVLMSPQKPLGRPLIDSLVDRVERGKPILLIGTEPISDLGYIFNYRIADNSRGGNRIFDPVNNGGEMGFPVIEYENSEAYAVVPTVVESFSDPAIQIHTKATSGFAQCYDSTNNPCLSSLPVGFIEEDVGVLADEWMFRNQYLDQFPDNVNLFKFYIEKLIGETGSIVFDETYLEWAPVNAAGTHHFIEIQLNLGLVLWILLLLGLLIPILVGYQANIFNSSKDNFIDQTIEERLDLIHVERLPSAPLDAMENILMREKLAYSSRGKYYIQLIANELLNKIHQYDLNWLYTNQELSQLEQLTKSVYDTYSSWRVVELGYAKLLSEIQENTKRRLL